MGWFEEKFIFPLPTNLSDFYLRFMDGVLLIWNGAKIELYDFLKKSYDCLPSIKFENEISKTEINFLETTVLKVHNKLRIKVHVKLNNRHLVKVQ